MIFLASIGNTNLTCGLYNQGIAASGRFRMADLREQRDVESAFVSFLERHRLPPGQIDGVALASVVPERTPLFLAAAKSCFSAEPLMISGETDWGFDRSAYSGLVGTDRLLCCKAALTKCAPSLIIIDCGTATTLSVLDGAGAFVGGVILPGVFTGLRALSAKAAQLRPVPFFHPAAVIGRNTEECVMSGATYGSAALLEGLVTRIRRELEAEAAVILTGGNAEVLLPHSAIPLRHEPELLLEGLALMYMERTNFTVRGQF